MNPFQLNRINFFQFDNLVKNRVPFCLINLGPSLIDWYSSIYKTHLETYEVSTQPETALAEVSQKNLPLDHAILVVCENGDQSLKLLNELEKKGYTNVYVVNGGYQQMMTERDQN